MGNVERHLRPQCDHAGFERSTTLTYAAFCTHARTSTPPAPASLDRASCAPLQGGNETALIIAAYRKRLEVCVLLLGAGASAEARDAACQGPLDYLPELAEHVRVRSG